MCADEAEATELASVRERCRRSKDTWLAMAERAARRERIEATTRA